MSESKNWMSLAAIRDAIAELATRIRTRIDPPSQPAQPARSATTQPASATSESGHEAGAGDG